MSLRKSITAGILVVWMSLSCSGVLVILRDGTRIQGDVISKDNTNIVLKIETGEKSVKWRTMKTSCFKQLNPELYEELKRKREERIRKKDDAMRAKGLVKGTKWIKKEEAEMPKYKWVRMKVAVNEVKRPIKKSNQGPGSSHECYLLVTVELDGLTRNNNYELKVKCRNYLRGQSAATSEIIEGQKIEKNETISGQTDYTGEFKTKPYNYKKLTFRILHRSTTHIWGYESEGHDLEVYLDGKLVYKDTKSTSPEYHIISRM